MKLLDRLLEWGVPYLISLIFALFLLICGGWSPYQ
jgi:hypothetical protein